MEPEDILLIITLILIAYDIVLFTRRGGARRGLGVGLSALGFTMFVAYYILFIRAFLVSDFSIEQVYDYSSSSLPWTLKLFASWGGSSGSLLMIAFFIGIAYIGYRLYIARTPSKESSVPKLLGVLFLYFIVLTLFKGPFQRFSAAPPDGMGLNPQLQSVWMFYHPLVVFAGYAFVVLAFALTLAQMETGARQGRLLGLSLKFAWLLLTVGIALGGLWAYQVLGWGGYWTWDPVETASLLPLLALTAYFHGASTGARKDLFQEFMVVLSFDSLLFLSALTRGGLLNSVHAYAFSPVGPALLICAVAATAYFFYLKNGLGKPLFSWPGRQASMQSKLMFVSQFSLLGVFWVCFTGVIIPTAQNIVTGTAESTSFEFYNYVSLPFVLAFMIGSMFCGASSKSIRLRLYVLGATIAASLVFLVVGFPSTLPVTNAVIPLLITAAIMATIGVVTVITKNRSIALTGRQVMHLGVLVVLFGVFVSSSMSNDAQSVSVNVSFTARNVLGLDLSVGNATMGFGSGKAYISEIDLVAPEQSSMTVDLHISLAGKTYSGVLVGQYYPNYGLVAHPIVLGDGITDVYVNLVLDQTSYDSLFNALLGTNTPPETLTLQVSTKPLVNVIWWGAALMSIGIIMSLPSIFSGSDSKVSKPDVEH
jgi:cytochrome c-type biogenesis protein CcmF